MTEQMLENGLASSPTTRIGHQEKGCSDRELPQQEPTLAFPHLISFGSQCPTVTSAFVGMG